jgi:hypothetical protein
MDEEQRVKAARMRKAQERIGQRDATCPYCGEADPRCLEAHHIAGRKFAADTVAICRNCHRKLSDAQADHPKVLGEDPNWMERVGHMLDGLADLLGLAVQKLRELAKLLIEKAKLNNPVGAMP